MKRSGWAMLVGAAIAATACTSAVALLTTTTTTAGVAILRDRSGDYDHTGTSHDLFVPTMRLLAAAVAVAVLVSACTSAEPTSNTYADEDGRLWYKTDCPDADVLLLAGADGLPGKETTERARVEASAEGVSEYTVIPRNGWVWERASDGSVLVSQVEDYMLERTIQSLDQCPNVPSHNGMGIPIAYRISTG